MLLQICSAPWTSYPHCRERRAVGGGGGGGGGELPLLCGCISGAQTHASKEKRCVSFPQRHEVCAFAEKAWCDYRHKPLVKEHSTLLGHLQRHHKDQLREPDTHSTREFPFALAGPQ